MFAVSLLMLPYTQYKTTCLSDIKQSLSRCITSHDVCVQQPHETKRLLP